MTSSRLSHLVLGLVLCCGGCRPEPPAPTPPVVAEEPPPVDPQSVLDGVFDRWVASNPVNATSLGEHAHDAQWPDLEAEAIARDRRRIEQDLSQLRALDPETLSPEQRVDLALMRNALQLQLFEHEVEPPWVRDPFWYAGIIGRGLDDLVSRDFAPLSERAEAVAGRLEALPRLIEQAQASIDPADAMAPQTEIALSQLDGVASLIQDVIPARTAEAPDSVRGRIAAATAPALEAVEGFRDFLRQRVVPNASGDWRLGEEQFERKLKLTLQTDLSAPELRRIAVVEHGRVRKQMSILAQELAEHLLTPGQVRRIRRSTPGDADAAVVAAVLDELGDWRVQPQQLRDHIETTLARLDGFVREKDIVRLDEAEVLQVIWTPPHERGVFIAGLAAPGPLESGKEGLPSFYLVQPIPETWDAATTESFLREYNNFMLEVLSIHEAIPGHFVQLYYGKRAPSRIRKALQNGAFVEGWAVYAEKVMIDYGYAGAAPPERPRGMSRGLWTVVSDEQLRAKAIALHRLKFYLRSVTNAILDHAIHTTNMSREEAIELMVARSFQQEGEAVGKWVRAQVTSTQLSTYFVGAQAWSRLREQAQQRASSSEAELDLSVFHEQALSHGAPPVHMLPDLMGWTEESTPSTPTDPAPSEPPDTSTADESPPAP